MRKIKVSQLFVTVILSLLFLTGCSFYPETVKFTEFPQYENFNADIVEIDVSWDVGEDQPVTFKITKESAIESIVEGLVEMEFLKSEPMEGGNSSIILVDVDGVQTTVPLSQIRYGESEQYYSFQSLDLYFLIFSISQNQPTE